MPLPFIPSGSSGVPSSHSVQVGGKAMPDLPAFKVVPPNENLKVEDFRLPDGSPLTGPDGYLVPPAREFSMVLNAATRVYSYRFDEAMRDSWVKARAMRRDAFIRGLLEERILPTINRRWQLDVDDDRDPNQRAVRDALTKVVEAIPDFDAYKRALLDGVWFGRAGTQWNYWRNPEVDDLWTPRRWDPVHGDSIQFTFDGVPAILMDAMTAGWYSANGATQGQWGDIRSTDRGGMALVLQRPTWRNRFAIHQHIREKADYFEGELAGSVQGLGLRGLVYWHYLIRTDALTWMLAYMQSVGQMDMLIFNYPWGNDAAKRQQEANANKIIGKAAFVVPRNPQGSWEAVTQLSMNDAGLKALHDLISEYFDRHIERLIVGQSMSAGADNESGLGGSGRANFAKATKDEILVYDTNRLDEVLTRDLIRPLKQYNFKWARFPVRFKSVLPNLEADKKVASGKTMVELKVPIKMDELREAAGFSRPEEGDEVVQPPPDPNAGPMGEMGMGPPGIPPGPGGPPPSPGLPGQPQPQPQPPSGGVQPPVQQVSTADQTQANVPVNPTSRDAFQQGFGPSFNSRTPVSYVTDARGHEHKGKGPGGGQFTERNQGGQSSQEKSQERRSETVPDVLDDPTVPPPTYGVNEHRLDAPVAPGIKAPRSCGFGDCTALALKGAKKGERVFVGTAVRKDRLEEARAVWNGSTGWPGTRMAVESFPHAWNMDKDGQIVDRALGSEDAQGYVYFGMEVPPNQLRSIKNDKELTDWHLENRGESPDSVWFAKHPVPTQNSAQRYDAAPSGGGAYFPGGANTYLPKFDETEIGFTRNAHAENPTQYKGGPHKFGCVMAPLTGQAAIELLSRASLVRDCDLTDDGRETDPHVTVRYGFHDGVTMGDAARELAGKGPVELTLGKVSCFYGEESGKDYDVVKVDVTSPQLRAMNSILGRLPCTDSHREYRPHATIAYVQRGKGREYARLIAPLDLTVTVDELEFSDATGAHGFFRLHGLRPANESLKYVKDASGHEHKGKGPGGGQFTSRGGDSSPETTASEKRGYAPIKPASRGYTPTVDGREVLPEVPNTNSIGSSVEDPEVLPGLYEIPMSAFDPDYKPRPHSPQERQRLDKLKAAISHNKQISPLIVVIDDQGPYVLEGGHRFDALHELGAKAFPAMVVVDKASAGEDPESWKWSFAPEPTQNRSDHRSVRYDRRERETPGQTARRRVLKQLSEDYSDEAVEWVSQVDWEGPRTVPVEEIDYSNVGDWRAGRNPEKVRKFAKRIESGQMKPIILIRKPNNPKFVIVDGHHRALAYRKLGVPALAYVARVPGRDGPWDEMHASQRADLGEESSKYARLYRDPTRYEAAHAPKGGVTVAGQSFSGGQFIPSEVMAQATPEERAEVGGQPSEPVKRKGKTGRSKSIEEAAKSIEVTDDEAEKTVSRDDYEEIEAEMTPSERRRLERAVDEARDSYVDERMERFKFSVDEEDAARDAGWSDKEIEKKALSLIDDSWKPEAETALKEAIKDWYKSTSEHGVAALDELASRLRDDDEWDFSDHADLIDGLRDEAESDIEAEIESAREKAEEEARESFAEDFDESEVRADYLSEWYDENEDRFSEDLENGKWGVDSDGDRVFYFETSGGGEYEINAVARNPVAGENLGHDEAFEISFTPKGEGQYKITGAGGAHEVFSTVTAAVTALALKKDAKVLSFTAAEPSRIKLYDRLVRTVASVAPQYDAVSIDSPNSPRRYMIVEKSKMPFLKDLVETHIPQGKVENLLSPTGYAKEQSRVEVLTPASPEEIRHWGTAAAWDEADHPRSARGQFTTKSNEGSGKAPNGSPSAARPEPVSPVTASVLNRLPRTAYDRLSSRVTRVTEAPTVEAVTEAWYAGEPGYMGKRTPCYGFYDPGTGELVTGPGGPGVDQRGVVAHEVGHALDQSDDRRHFDLSGHPEFLSAWRDEMGRGQLSRYATTDEVEGFAEFCRLLYGTDNGAERAEREFPRSYAYFRRVGLVS